MVYLLGLLIGVLKGFTVLEAKLRSAHRVTSAQVNFLSNSLDLVLLAIIKTSLARIHVGHALKGLFVLTINRRRHRHVQPVSCVIFKDCTHQSKSAMQATIVWQEVRELSLF